MAVDQSRLSVSLAHHDGIGEREYSNHYPIHEQTTDHRYRLCTHYQRGDQQFHYLVDLQSLHFMVGTVYCRWLLRSLLALQLAVCPDVCLDHRSLYAQFRRAGTDPVHLLSSKTDSIVLGMVFPSTIVSVVAVIFCLARMRDWGSISVC